MIYPWQLALSLTRYVALSRLQGRKRFPLVLMLEPTFRCNLACAGCGRIWENKEIGGRMLSVEECLAAVDEAGSPVVCVTGGEPLLHPEIKEIVDGLVARKRFTFLATNGIEAEESLPKFEPSPYFSFVFHLDGLAETHDRNAGRRGVFDTAIAGIKAAKQAGFQVRTNTTIYKRFDWNEIRELFVLLSRLEIDGMMVAPAFSYEKVDADIFLSRNEVVSTFQPICEHREQFRFYNTPIYLEFLAGKRTLQCTPWSTPTRNPKGWKKPCYLITDGYCTSFAELLQETPWEKYGVGNDPRCANCMVHSGFEASAIDEVGKSLPDLWHMLKWNFFTN
jgi:hopanoid biosynthesis associated radical SAM protein HpnH